MDYFEIYFGIALASSIMSFILGMIACAQIMKPAPAHKPAPATVAKSTKTTQTTVSLGASAFLIKTVNGQRRRDRRLGRTPLWRHTGEFPAVKARLQNTEEIEEVR